MTQVVPTDLQASSYAALARESDALHARVVEFAESSLASQPISLRDVPQGGGRPGGVLGRATRARFEALALQIADFQARHQPGYARLMLAQGGMPTRVRELPAVPAELFRATRVAVHPPELDVARFVTSGTTDAEPGVHPLRTTATYRHVALAWGRRCLLPQAAARVTVVALAPEPAPQGSSSLAFMMRAMMESWDGRALAPTALHARGDGPCVSEPGRWLVDGRGVREDALRAAARVAAGRGEPLLLLATSFAMVELLDRLAGRSLPLPPKSVVMLTGGFKGRTRAVDPAELLRALCGAFGLAERQLIGEYGMTELSSQLYEVHAGGAVAPSAGSTFVPPPWLEVSAVDPLTLRPLAQGEVGLARFVDLANVDSALVVLTDDQVRVTDGGVELLGRRRGARPRGCSLAIEELLGA